MIAELSAAPACARPGCTEPVGRCYRTTSEAHARLCVRHRASQSSMDSHRKRVAAGWVAADEQRSVRIYDTERRGVVIVAPAGVWWMIAHGPRVVAIQGGYASRVAAERACDEEAGR